MVKQQTYLSNKEKEQLRVLWNTAYPESLFHETTESLSDYLESLNQAIHFVILKEEVIIGWAAVFTRDHERWFLLIIDPNHQKSGLGSKLLQQIKQTEKHIFGWVVTSNLLKKKDKEPYASPLRFYLRNGFTLCADRFKSEVLETVKIEWKSSNPAFYQDKLESDRLITRFLTSEDISWWTTFLSNDEATKHFYLDKQKSAEVHSKEWIERQLLRYKNGTFGHQVLIEKASEKKIGQAGLLLQELNNDYVIEVGYHILPEFWGKGFAPEAAKLFINEAFKNNWTAEIISMIDIGNEKSVRVAEKNGLSLRENTTWNNFNIHVYALKQNVE